MSGEATVAPPKWAPETGRTTLPPPRDERTSNQLPPNVPVIPTASSPKASTIPRPKQEGSMGLMAAPFWFNPSSAAFLYPPGPLQPSAEPSMKLPLNEPAKIQSMLSSFAVNRPPPTTESTHTHEDLPRLATFASAPMTPMGAEPASAVFQHPQGRMLSCNARAQRLLEEIGCPPRPNLHWSDILSVSKEASQQLAVRVETFADVCVNALQHVAPQQLLLPIRLQSGAPWNLILTLVPLQQRTSDSIMMLWILEYESPHTHTHTPHQPAAAVATAPGQTAGGGQLSAPSSLPRHAGNSSAPPHTPHPASVDAAGHPPRRDSKKFVTEDLHLLAEKAEKKRKDKPWVAATVKWNVKPKKSNNGRTDTT